LFNLSATFVKFPLAAEETVTKNPQITCFSYE